VRVSRSDIPAVRIPADTVLHAQIGPSGYVSAIVLNNQTGDAYTYGFVRIEQSGPHFDSISGQIYTTTRAGVSPGTGSVVEWFDADNAALPRAGAIVGITAVNVISGSAILSEAVTCVRHTGLTRHDFNGSQSVVINGSDIPVAAGVQVFVPAINRLMNIAEARAHCSTFDVYTDPEGRKVRVIVGQL
jgi:hypothetical protein